jgi:hypothetical protein
VISRGCGSIRSEAIVENDDLLRKEDEFFAANPELIGWMKKNREVLIETLKGGRGEDCLKDDEICAYVDNLLNEDDKKRVENHIKSCVHCFGEVNRLKKDLAMMEDFSYSEELRADVDDKLLAEERSVRIFLVAGDVGEGLLLGRLYLDDNSNLWASLKTSLAPGTRVRVSIRSLKMSAEGEVVKIVGEKRIKVCLGRLEGEAYRTTKLSITREVKAEWECREE